MPEKLVIFGDRRSGNCLKVLWTAQQLNIPYEWRDVDVLSGKTREDDFLKRNPAGQVPTVILEDGQTLAQSNAIILHLTERAGADLLPAEAFWRAKVYEWLFWEQYSHEPTIAVRRFQKAFLGMSDAEIDPKLMEKGLAALARMELALSSSPFLVGDSVTLADIALVAYTRLADEGGFDLAPFSAVTRWVERMERVLDL